MQDCSDNVKNIAKEPDDDEGEGKAIGGGPAKIFYDLRGVDDDPAGYRYRTEKRQNPNGLKDGGGDLTQRCRSELQDPSGGPMMAQTWRR